MAKKKNKLTYIVVVALLVLFLAQAEKKEERLGREMINIEFLVKSADGTIQAIVVTPGEPAGYLVEPDAQGSFTVTIENQEVVPVYNVSLVDQCDDADGDQTWTQCSSGSPFELGAARIQYCDYDPPGSCSTPGDNSPWDLVDGYRLESFGGSFEGRQDAIVGRTPWFSLEDYTESPWNMNGDVRFNFMFEYSQVNPGTGVMGSPQGFEAYADIGLYFDTCSDGTLWNTDPNSACSDATPGSACLWDGPGSGAVYLDETQYCCETYSGLVWDVDHCVSFCTHPCPGPPTVALGGCVTLQCSAFTPQTDNYCNPSTAVLEESCTNCDCLDYYGNTQQSCSGSSCVWRTYDTPPTIDITGAEQ